MIPPFEPSGYLPPGVHPAPVAEIAERFGSSSEIRRVQMESLRWMVALATRAGVRRIVLNGSFVTDIIEPADVDCVLLAADAQADAAAERDLQAGLPFLDIELVAQAEFEEFVNVIFGLDRRMRPKGVIEVQP